MQLMESIVRNIEFLSKKVFPSFYFGGNYEKNKKLYKYLGS